MGVGVVVAVGVGVVGVLIIVFALVVGTAADPQDTAHQIAALTEAGAIVHRTIGSLIDDLNSRLPRTMLDAPPVQWRDTFAALNVGVETFYDSLQAQEAAVTQVDWRPPAGGNERMMAILAKFRTVNSQQ